MAKITLTQRIKELEKLNAYHKEAIAYLLSKDEEFVEMAKKTREKNNHKKVNQ